jgi:hypothetical protein
MIRSGVGAKAWTKLASAAGSNSENVAEVAAAGGPDPQRCVHVDADHMPARRDSQLARAGEQNVAGFVPLPTDQGVLAVGAEPSVGSGLASGTRQAVVAAGSAVLGLSAQLEVPAAEGP